MWDRAWVIGLMGFKWLFAAIFVAGGINHFVAPDIYLKIMPPYLPWHRELVFLSGFFEVSLGIMLLIPATSRLAAWGLIALLIAVFPANIHLYQHQEIAPRIPGWAHLLRLPLQGVLIYWAHAYTQRQPVTGSVRKIRRTRQSRVDGDGSGT
jgi:uncharacterized membrane protein